MLPFAVAGQTIKPGRIWKDNRGIHINAHGGCVISHGGKYYWYGEHKSDDTSSAMVGVTCYSSENLVDWTYEGVALPVSDEAGHDIERGCILERPKVVYNEATRRFVMWFHLELKGRGYADARYGVAMSDSPVGPFRFIRSGRVNPGLWPMDMSQADRDVADALDLGKYTEWWTPAWRDAIVKGLFVKRDMKAHDRLPAGQMARDMTIYVDSDGRAYHIYSSEDNLTIQVAELTDDYTDHTGKYVRVAPGGMNEAPAIFKKDGKYWMITSGCTGWDPNEARMFSADNIWGPWLQHPNPCVGPKAEKTFGGQGTYVLHVGNSYIFMADVWRPEYPSDARYIWLPIEFDKGSPVIRWKTEWSPGNM
ncbi:glycoside hydrolase family 43 protein [Marseilla massiliensis]|uniref:glycoside hydrolase family 43 protein n=1 Tax=Marseilla massiliensis TaxID=1841864 RepID=UPI0020129AF9|nr:glycoside hydrolase family 43 protein [Marseilla massiliensis]MCL1609969.1 glycoside hydrolase family 43 protein [Marseilla massiliensis]